MWGCFANYLGCGMGKFLYHKGHQGIAQGTQSFMAHSRATRAHVLLASIPYSKWYYYPTPTAMYFCRDIVVVKVVAACAAARGLLLPKAQPQSDAYGSAAVIVFVNTDIFIAIDEYRISGF